MIFKRNVYEVMEKVYKEIEKTDNKEREYELYTEIQRLKESEAILRFRNREDIEEEIRFHKETQREVMSRFSEDQMKNLFQMILFKPKVTELFRKEQRNIFELQKQLSVFNNFSLGEDK